MSSLLPLESTNELCQKALAKCHNNVTQAKERLVKKLGRGKEKKDEGKRVKYEVNDGNPKRKKEKEKEKRYERERETILYSPLRQQSSEISGLYWSPRLDIQINLHTTEGLLIFFFSCPFSIVNDPSNIEQIILIIF